MLLDGDDAGKEMARDLQNGLYQSAKGKIKNTDKYVGFANPEIEDLFPHDFLVAAVDRIVPYVDGEYVARMEDVLEAPDPERLLVCFDETPRQLTRSEGHTRRMVLSARLFADRRGEIDGICQRRRRSLNDRQSLLC